MIREYTNKIIELLDEGILEPKGLAEQLLAWLSEDDAKCFYFANCFHEYFEEDEVA